MSIVLDVEALDALRAAQRTKGQHVARLNKFISDGNIGEDITSEYPSGTNLKSVVAGLKQQINSKTEKYGMVEVLTKKDSDGNIVQVVLYNKVKHTASVAVSE
jgi:hypothetical protein